MRQKDICQVQKGEEEAIQMQGKIQERAHFALFRSPFCNIGLSAKV